ncbi:MAG: anhydro-N-acetylmuramic acid kinase [Epsilonproteobacteria bacterium]|nr:anhydro-N-acetylmuramic acid kinase [Campylobacterota bacterium]
MSKLYIGIMSGTSLDGIDITLCKIDAKNCKLIASSEYLFDKEIKKEILHLINNKILLRQIGMLNVKLGHIFADAVLKFLKEHKIDAKKVRAIGLHGQTIWHEPDGDLPFSMQLGCPNIVSAKTNITVVNDFRSMDMAHGGQGAPFAPAFHQFLFAKKDKKVAVLNIGGMANITILGKDLKGWDVGPGNVLMDLWITKCKKVPFDKKGKFANSGKINQELLELMLDDNYFYKEGPKSTGREKFNKKYIASKLSNFQDLKDRDIQRTFLELTAKTIARDVKNNKIKELILCGGGVKNITLLKRIKKLTKIDVASSESYGVSSDFMESMAFAWFAYKRIHNEVIKISSVTGASKNSVLGGIYG